MITTSLELSENELNKFTQLVYELTKVHLEQNKKTMLSGRLLKRMRVLKITSFMDYYELITHHKNSDELQYFLDNVTTHKTHFFRENHHFEYLKECIKKWNSPIRGWSAASSTGEEPYSIAMTLSDSLAENFSAWSLLCTDISPGVISTAQKAVYEQSLCEDIPENYFKKYMMIGKNDLVSKVRIVPEIRHRMQWRTLNLDTEIDQVDQKFHFIFLRNVMIYFDLATRQKVISALEKKLLPGGLLFIGHAESLMDIQTSFERAIPTVYQLPS
jgi:chemotaxis protein methyltransferase CheR